LLVRLANQGKAVLAQRIETANYDAKKAGRIPVVVRCSDFGGKPGTALHRQLGHLAKEGGRRVVVEQATWKTLLAFKSFCEQQRSQPGFAGWLKSERPLLKLHDLRALLGLPLGDDAQDGFRAPRVVSNRPNPIAAPPRASRATPTPRAPRCLRTRSSCAWARACPSCKMPRSSSSSSSSGIAPCSAPPAAARPRSRST
jgi:hypothetical protein